MSIQREFIGVFIPASIYLDQKLMPLEKLFWAEVNALSQNRACTASNNHFKEHLSIHPRTVPKIIKKLVDLGYMICRIVNKNERELFSVFPQKLYSDYPCPTGHPPMPSRASPPMPSRASKREDINIKEKERESYACDASARAKLDATPSFSFSSIEEIEAFVDDRRRAATSRWEKTSDGEAVSDSSPAKAARRAKLSPTCVLFDSDRQKLEAEFGKTRIEDLIEKMQEWCAMKANGGYAWEKGWNLAIRKWIKNEKSTQTAKNTPVIEKEKKEETKIDDEKIERPSHLPDKVKTSWGTVYFELLDNKQKRAWGTQSEATLMSLGMTHSQMIHTRGSLEEAIKCLKQ